MKDSLATRTVVIEGKEYSYTLRRSYKAKNVLVHVSNEGEIEVVVPRWVAYRVGESFLRSKEVWLRRVIAHSEARRLSQPARAWVSGETLPLFERRITLAVHRDVLLRRNYTVQEGTVLHVHVRDHDSVRPAVIAWYRRAARHYFTTTSAELATILGYAVSRIRIGEQKTQWGSCSSRGVLSFNWRLLLGPERIARYVAAHEVAHLKTRRHSPRFWRCVAELHATAPADRRWLKEHGHTLRLKSNTPA